jgi:hypothetical protein
LQLLAIVAALARRNGNGPFKGFNDINDRNRRRIFREDVSPVGALLGNQQSFARQSLQYFSQQFGGNVVLSGYLASADGFVTVLRQMFEAIKP